MERVYLLLRQNTESGPYTLPELKQLQLQPTDLIWVEGTSTSWSSADSLTEPLGKSFRGPETNSWIAPRTEPGRQPAKSRSDAPAAFAIGAQPATQQRLSKTDTEEDLELILHKRGGPTVSLVQLLGVAGITALLALAWDHRFKLVQTRDSSITYASPPVIFTPSIPPAPQNSVVLPAALDSINLLSKPVGVEQFVKSTRSKKPLQSSRNTAPKATDPGLGEVNKAQKASTQTVEVVPPSPVQEVPTDSAGTGEHEKVSEREESKKKTLGQAIKGLFRKKGKREKSVDEGVDN